MPLAELERLAQDARREQNWTRWGAYLAERQWGTVREDYSATGECWSYLPHDHARSRTYRWGEDGLLGITDRECRLCFALALWNGRDPILKERLFGLDNVEGNHGEDAKECWYYLDATPTASYLKALYRYPQAEFPYAQLVAENRRRTRLDPEFELIDTGVLDGNRFFDVYVEYAKAAPDDLAIRITVANRGPEPATIHLLPSLWFRNTWSWGRSGEGYPPQPRLSRDRDGSILAEHATLGAFRLVPGLGPLGATPRLLFTHNATNSERLFQFANATPYVKDAFHEYVVRGRNDAVHPSEGTRAAALYTCEVPPDARAVLRLRLHAAGAPPADPLGPEFEQVFDLRRRECDAFHDALDPRGATDDEKKVLRQGRAGLLWSRQFYHYVVREWLDGDPAQPTPPRERLAGRNAAWRNLHARDVLSVPDAWEYPWFAAWDLAFHMIPLARLDPEFAKAQLVLLLREWYAHPNGQQPAYEFAFSDVNPPVHAWACWRVYKLTGAKGSRDRMFLERTFQKLLMNFTWWVNRKDEEGNNLFGGGFLGLDNIGVFDRSKPIPGGGSLEQADGTAWMAFYCTTMLAMALELAAEDPAYEDVASKFFEHFVAIVDSINAVGGHGLWDEDDGFYYDHLHADGMETVLRVRSLVGVIPLFAVEVLDPDVIARLPGFAKRMRWLLENRADLARHVAYMDAQQPAPGAAHPGAGLGLRLLAVPSRERLARVLKRVLDESEFLSPYGVRSLSRAHRDQPFTLDLPAMRYTVDYEPGESTTGLFGGNSNWRGPVWFPLNFLLIESLERYHYFYGDSFTIECPTGSGKSMTLGAVACELERRLASLFLAGPDGRRPSHGRDGGPATDPLWRDLVLFHEYFDGDTGRGCGASHQTGWTALVVNCLEDAIRDRASAPDATAQPAGAGTPRGS